MKRRLRRGGCLAWRQVARTVDCHAPGFVEADLSGCGGGWLWLFLPVGVGCPGGFVLCGGAHADGGVGSDGVEPVDPLDGGELNGVDVLPRSLAKG